MGSLTVGQVEGLGGANGGGGNGSSGGKACPSQHQITYLVPPKKAEPAAAATAAGGDDAAAAQEGEGAVKAFEARLAEALRDAQCKILKVSLGGGHVWVGGWGQGVRRKGPGCACTTAPP